MTLAQRGIVLLMLLVDGAPAWRDVADVTPMGSMLEVQHEPAYTAFSVINMDAHGGESTIYTVDAHGEMQTATVSSTLGQDWKVHGVILGPHVDRPAGRTEWVSTALGGKKFAVTVPSAEVSAQRQNPQTFRVFALEAATISVDASQCPDEVKVITASLLVGELKEFSLKCLGATVRVTSTSGKILLKVSNKGAVDTIPVPPVSEVVYGSCSVWCILSIFDEDATANVNEKCSDGTSRTFQVTNHEVFKEEAAGTYTGKSCVWKASNDDGANMNMAGISSADGTGHDATSLLPKSLFRMVTPIPPLKFLKLVSDQSTGCTFRPADPALVDETIQLSSQEDSLEVFQVFHARLSGEVVSYGGVLSCNKAVMALGDILAGDESDTSNRKEVQLIST